MLFRYCMLFHYRNIYLIYDTLQFASLSGREPASVQGASVDVQKLYVQLIYSVHYAYHQQWNIVFFPTGNRYIDYCDLHCLNTLVPCNNTSTNTLFSSSIMLQIQMAQARFVCCLCSCSAFSIQPLRK